MIKIIKEGAMEKCYKLSLVITAKEIEFLKTLLKEEAFQLSGLDAVIKDKEIKKEIAVAEALEKKIQSARLVAA
ncbi:MAG TPA: hypothetical protein VFO38_06615 [Candidatus Saccharimonadales bacterium]|nr:hypothetical protein [Candidatus Saccharimonadales bacterium]